MNIDELVVTFSLDPTKFNQGTKEGRDLLKKFKDEVKKTADDTDAQSARMVDGFSRVTKELLGLGAVALGIGGLKDMAQATVAAGTATGRLAAFFDLDPQMLNRWQSAMKNFGIEAGVTAGAIGTLATAIATLKLKGGGSMLAGSQALGAMGITNPSEDPETLLRQINQALQNPKNRTPAMAAALAQDIPGISTILLGLESSRLPELLATSATATAKQIEAAGKITDAFIEVEKSVDRIKNKAMEIAAPGAESFARTTAKNIDDFTSTFLGKGDSPAPRTPLPTIFGAAGFKNWLLGFVDQMATDEQMGVPLSRPDADVSRPAARPWEIIPDTRAWGPEGFKTRDRYPRLGRQASSSVPPAAGMGTIYDDHSIVANVTVNVPVGTDPRTIGGMIATSLKGALPGIGVGLR
jgi:hypothetical protein